MSLENAFDAYTSGSTEMAGVNFVKLLKDAKIIDSKFTSTDADLIFAKVKAKGCRKIKFAQFETALAEVAQRKKVSPEDINSKICGQSEGPVLHGTVPEAVRFHDDKSLYTGVHQYGGPTTVDKGRTGFSDLSAQYLSELTDRSVSTIRGVSTKVANAAEGKTGKAKVRGRSSGDTDKADSSKKNLGQHVKLNSSEAEENAKHTDLNQQE